MGCRSFFGVEIRFGLGMLVMLGFLNVFAVRVVGSGVCFLLLDFYHAGSVSAPASKMSANKEATSSSSSG